MTHQGIAFNAPKPITSEKYQYKRQANEMWLEAHYDLNSAEGIRSIPEKSDLPRPPNAGSVGFRDYTCDVDYYLRFKSAWFEEASDIELAIPRLKNLTQLEWSANAAIKKMTIMSWFSFWPVAALPKKQKQKKKKLMLSLRVMTSTVSSNLSRFYLNEYMMMPNV